MDEAAFAFKHSCSIPASSSRSATSKQITVPEGIAALGGTWTRTIYNGSYSSFSITWTSKLRSTYNLVRAKVTLEAMGSAEGAAERGTVAKGEMRESGAGWEFEYEDYEVGGAAFLPGSVYKLSVAFTLRPRNWEERKHNAWVQDVIDAPASLNVTFFFHGNRTLHGNSTFLALNSPYFKTLFSSVGFSESSNKKQSITPAAYPPLTKKRAFHDSDDEADSPTPAPAHSSSYEVRVEETSYLTYRAVLSWMLTRQIVFARLSTASPLPPGDEVPTLSTLSSLSSLPATSPKSVYRLAHFLGLDELGLLALASIVSQIDPSNAIEELFGELTALYEPLQVALLDYAARNWDKVKQSKGWKELEGSIDAEEDVPVATTRLFAKLLRRLSKA